METLSGSNGHVWTHGHRIRPCWRKLRVLNLTLSQSRIFGWVPNYNKGGYWVLAYQVVPYGSPLVYQYIPITYIVAVEYLYRRS